MSRPEDDFTSTVDGAAAFERHHGQEEPEYWFDSSDVADDLEEPEEPEGHRPNCRARDFSECFC